MLFSPVFVIRLLSTVLEFVQSLVELSSRLLQEVIIMLLLYDNLSGRDMSSCYLYMVNLLCMECRGLGKA